MLNLSVNNYDFKDWKTTFSDHKVKFSISKVHESWRDLFEIEMKKKYFKEIEKFLSDRICTVNIFPYPDLVFNTFHAIPLKSIKVVFIGQDPYIRSVKTDKIVPEAMGLSFSVPKGIPVPPSLKNIYKNLYDNHLITKIPNHGNLSFWMYQGCLMLNSVLTVDEGCSNSHKSIWTKFTDSVIKYISNKCDNIVFVLWGFSAYQKRDLINENKHKLIISSHPSPLSVNNTMLTYPAFKDQDHFGMINKYLKSKGKTPIIWQLF